MNWWKTKSAFDITNRVTGLTTALFAPPEWATFHEIEFPAIRGHGYGVRRADILAIHCHESKGGKHAEAVEVKASVVDLRRELATPSKTESIARYCKRQWFAIPRGLVDIAEIPPQWGVIEVGEAMAKRTRKPIDNTEPADLPWSVAVALARRSLTAIVPDPQLLLWPQEGGTPGQAWRAFWARANGEPMTIDEVVEMSKAAIEGAQYGHICRAVDARIDRIKEEATHAIGAIIDWHRSRVEVASHFSAASRAAALDALGAEHELIEAVREWAFASNLSHSAIRRVIQDKGETK